MNNYEVFIKLLGGRFVDSTKVNFDIGRQLWSPLLFGCTVKQLLPNASTNFQKTFVESTLSQAKMSMRNVLFVSITLPYGCRL